MRQYDKLLSPHLKGHSLSRKDIYLNLQFFHPQQSLIYDSQTTLEVLRLNQQQFDGVGVDDFRDEIINYFEVRGIIDAGGLYAEGHPIVMITLNSSDTFKSSTPEVIGKRVFQTLERYKNADFPVHLVIDTTLDTNTKKLNDVIDQFKAPLEQGNLNILLCKSFQKYPSLGCGKIMAGNITIIKNEDINFNLMKIIYAELAHRRMYFCIIMGNYLLICSAQMNTVPM